MIAGPPRRTLLPGAVIGIVLAVQCLVAVRVALHDPRRIRTPDSSTYELPARAMLEDGRFWTAPGSGDPEIKRTPGYPALIAATYAAFGERRAAVILLQIFMNGAIVALIWRMAGRAGPAAGGVAAAFLCFDLPFLACAQYFLTETFFTLQIVLFAAAWIRMDDRPDASRRCAVAALAGLCLAGAALTRPIAYYLAPFAAAAAAVAARRGGLPLRRAAGCGLALLVPFAVLCGGWQLRNLRASGSAEFSQIKSVNLLRWRAAGIVALRDGIPFEAAQARLEQEIKLRHPAASGAELFGLYSAEGRRIIRSEPLLFVRTAVDGFIRMTLVPGEYVVLRLLGVDPPSGPVGDLARLGFQGFLRTWVLGRPWELLLFCFAALHLLALEAFALVSLWRLPSRPAAERSLALPAVALVGYFVLVSSGPEAYPRFRAPIAPFLALLAGIGVQRLLAARGRADRG